VNSFSGVGTTLFNMAVRPGTDSVFVTNHEARNEVRFEPFEAGGVQGHATEERISVLAGMSVLPVHVNPHIDYSGDGAGQRSRRKRRAARRSRVLEQWRVALCDRNGL
jgi:hypothetical protein